MRQRAPITWHRYAAEINDQKILREIRELHVEYSGRVRAKQRADPLTKFDNLNLTAFTVRVIELGLDVVRFRMKQWEPK